MKTEKNSLAKNVNELLADSRFLYIQEILRQPNLFNILSNATYEIRHSSFLAWLLNPNENHAAGKLFLSKLSALLISDAQNKGQNWSVFREKNNIDIILESEKETITIENKTFSKDSPGQLAHYRKTVTSNHPNLKNHFVYLTLHGEKPQDPEESNHWTLCSYSSILNELKAILSAHSDVISKKAQIYIKDYIDAVQIYSLKNHQANRNAKEIVADNKYKLMEIFDNLEGIKSIDAPQRDALVFLRNNSSFTRGNGFFRQNHFFYKAFKSALENHEFLVNERNNSTYLGFIDKNTFSSPFPPELNQTVGFAFRFYSNTSILKFGFGIAPETSLNKALRTKLINHIPKIKQTFGENAVNSKGNHHIGLYNKNIEFDPLLYTEENSHWQIDKLIESEVVNEARRIRVVIENILST